MATAATGLLLFWSYRTYGLWATVGSALLCLPLITSRTEVRPETISMLGVAIYFVTLYLFMQKRLSARWLWVILLGTQLFWQNTHLFFVLGLLLLFLFWLFAALKKDWQAWTQLGYLGIGAALITLINPNGVAGAVMPFTIFSEYGYRVAENQPLLFMLNRFGSPLLFYEVGFAAAGFLAFCWTVYSVTKATKKHDLLKEFLLVGSIFGILAVGTFWVIRLESFWGLMSIPFVSFTLAYFKNVFGPRLTPFLQTPLGVMALSTVSFCVLIGMGASGLFNPVSARMGLGLAPGTTGAAAFITENKLKGPIFNNYDSGGYLIYFLYPQERVFVDNRPEAYPTAFFANDYIAPQENSERWKELLAQHSFNLIVFFYHDMTNWGQDFLVARLDDPDWAPVYVDNYLLIFLRTTPENAALIDQFAVPRELFSVTRTN